MTLGDQQEYGSGEIVDSNMAEENTGHRQRLRERFLAGELESRSDDVLLELLLTFAIGRKNVMPLAQDLLQVFGSFSRVLAASPDELQKVQGIGQSSIALLKVVDFMNSGKRTAKTAPSLPQEAGATQQKLIENLPDESVTDSSRDPLASSQSAKNIHTVKESTQRKFQVSRSHRLEFNHFARIVNFLYEKRGENKISRDLLIENLGLPDGQVASLLSVGAAMGLIKIGSQTLTPIGLIIAEHDIFLEEHGTLEWCHYKGAGSYRNLIWFEVFNHVLAEESAMTQEEWQQYFRRILNGLYTQKSITDHVPKEVCFIVDAYMDGNFSKLDLLHRSSDERLYRKRYTGFAPLVLSAMIYDFCATRGQQLSQVGELVVEPGSPAMIFGLDGAALREQIEGLHTRGWLRYETTHNLDQIRLKPGFSALEFLSAHFEEREPNEDLMLSGGSISE